MLIVANLVFIALNILFYRVYYFIILYAKIIL